MSSLLTSPPARGAPTDDLVVATAFAVVGLLALAFVSWRYSRGGANPLRSALARASRLSELPEEVALPAGLVSLSLLTAVLGFYWDVATHIDQGRDAGPFSNAAHYPILFGLIGIALGGYLSILASTGSSRAPLKERLRTAPRGAWLILLSGTLALAGFPLDEIWHRLYGQDVTLWSPTHIQMVAGASLSTLGLWVLVRDGASRMTSAVSRGVAWLVKGRTTRLGGAFLLGLSTLQGEFDFGVPQFPLLYQPLLIVLAASIGLVCVRALGGRGSAIKALLLFLGLRGLITLIVGPGLGHLTMHFPLYIVEALLVEALAMKLSVERPSFGLISGLLIGTLGVAAEWFWSTVWMPIPWSAALLPRLLFLAPILGIAGGLMGMAIAAAIARRKPSISRPVLIAAFMVVLIGLWYPGRIDNDSNVVVDFEVQDVRYREGQREALLKMEIRPHEVTEQPVWLHVLSWQGDLRSAHITKLERSRDLAFVTESHVPIDGEWKTMLRLHTKNDILALPIYMPEDDAIPAKAIHPEDRETARLVPDRIILQREATTRDPWVHRLGNMAILLIGAVWLSAFARALFVDRQEINLG